MATVYEATDAYWIEAADMPQFPTLDRDLSVDVLVVGGGVTGITAAYLLTRAGRRVALIDRARLARMDTGLTTAHLTCVTDARLAALRTSFGDDHAQAAWDAGLAAISQIDACIRAENIECAFKWVPGYLHAPPGRGASTADRDDLREEADAASALGFDAQFVERVPFVNQPGVEFASQAQFNPRQYLAALVRAIGNGGGVIFENTPAADVTDEPMSVSAGGHAIRCDRIVVATHNPIVGAAGLIDATLLQTKLSLYSSYVVGGRIPAGLLPHALFWDTADPYRYLRVEPHRQFDFAIFGGEDHKTGQEPDTRARFARLETDVRRLIPEIHITHRWSGQVIETNDGLPLIGDMAPRQFAATGFAGNGMTFGTLGAMMACDWAVGRPNPWSELFDPGRTKIRGGLWNYLKENKDYPYYLIRDRFAGPDARTLRAVPRGAGRLVDLDGTRVAAYRAADGSITLLSPVCTHMGCHVTWNSSEQTWDCPCHGSRFAPTGAVLAGPAESRLDAAVVPSTS
jgi:glycine/D-amino acid oxidase-like deaminating enzyme/nitrite reductase/ring-hydroxylating ferredoxin subunit